MITNIRDNDQIELRVERFQLVIFANLFEVRLQPLPVKHDIRKGAVHRMVVFIPFRFPLFQVEDELLSGFDAVDETLDETLSQFFQAHLFARKLFDFVIKVLNFILGFSELAISFTRHVGYKYVFILLLAVFAIVSNMIENNRIKTLNIALIAIVTIILIQSRLLLQHCFSQLVRIKFLVFVEHVFFLIFVFQILIEFHNLFLELLVRGVKNLIYFFVTHEDHVFFVLNKLRS